MEYLCRKYTPDLTDDSVWIINTPSETATSFLMYVQETGLFHAKPDYYTEYRDVSSFLIMLTLDGQGTYRIDGKSYELNKGDLVFVDSMEYHTHKTSAKGPGFWDILWVQFNGIAARGYYNQYKTAGQHVLKAGENTRFADLLNGIVEYNRINTVGAEFSTSGLLVELLTEILFEAEAVTSPHTNIPAYINTALKDIENHFTENLSLDYFEKEYCVSKFHFAKEFKRYIGFSPIEYIINVRLSHAKEYLQFTNMTIQEISEAVGFNNNCHFINMFKQKVGITPYKFRKQYYGAKQKKTVTK